MISIVSICLSLAVLGSAQPQRFSLLPEPQMAAPVPQGTPLSAPLVLLPKEYFVNVAPNSPYQQFGAPAQQNNMFGQYQNQANVFPNDQSNKYTSKQQKEDEAQQKKKSQQQKEKSQDNEQSADFTQQTDLNQQLPKAPIYFISQQFYSKDGQFGQLNQSPSQIGKETSSSATTEADPATTEASTTESAQDPSANLESEDSEDVENKEGLYYLLLPDGKLQKIVYMTKEDLKKMQLSANIQYQNVEPIVGPIYSYNPSTSPYVKVL